MANIRISDRSINNLLVEIDTSLISKTATTYNNWGGISVIASQIGHAKSTLNQEQVKKPNLDPTTAYWSKLQNNINYNIFKLAKDENIQKLKTIRLTFRHWGDCIPHIPTSISGNIYLIRESNKIYAEIKNLKRIIEEIKDNAKMLFYKIKKTWRNRKIPLYAKNNDIPRIWLEIKSFRNKPYKSITEIYTDNTNKHTTSNNDSILKCIVQYLYDNLNTATLNGNFDTAPKLIIHYTYTHNKPNFLTVLT